MHLTIAGTEYVGLVAGVCFTHVGHKVTRVETDPKKVEMLDMGISPSMRRVRKPTCRMVSKKGCSASPPNPSKPIKPRCHLHRCRNSRTAR